MHPVPIKFQTIIAIFVWKEWNKEYIEAFGHEIGNMGQNTQCRNYNSNNDRVIPLIICILSCFSMFYELMHIVSNIWKYAKWRNHNVPIMIAVWTELIVIQHHSSSILSVFFTIWLYASSLTIRGASKTAGALVVQSVLTYWSNSPRFEPCLRGYLLKCKQGPVAYSLSLLPALFLIQLKCCWKGCKIAGHPLSNICFIHPVLRQSSASADDFAPH